MSSNIKSSLASSDLIQPHPPERGKRSNHLVVLSAGCCCCCCCLHTVGGMIGAAVVGNYRAELDESVTSPHPPKRLPSSQKIFWSSVLWTILVSVVICGLLNLNQPGNVNQPRVEAFFDMDTHIWLAILGPALLLVASGLSAFQIAIRIDRAFQKGYWRHLGKITLGILAGSIIGGLMMGLFLLH